MRHEGLAVVLAALAALACSRGRHPAPQTDAEAAPRKSLAAVAASVKDAAPAEPDAERIRPGDVLAPAEAERAIGAGRTTETDAPGERAGGPLVIETDRVGPYRIGMTRADLLRALRGRGTWKDLPTADNAPLAESVTVAGENALPLLRMRVYAGRLTEVDVLASQIGTDQRVQVGAAFSDAIAAHGDPRLVRDEKVARPLGFVLSDLPGVLFVPGSLAAATATGRIVRMAVVGPEATSPPD